MILAPLIENLLSAVYCAECFMYITSFGPPNNPMKKVLYYSERWKMFF